MVNKVVSIPAQTQAYKVAYKSGFHCHTVERLTDSIQTIILPKIESLKPRFIVYKTVSKQTLQTGLHLKRQNLWRAHVYVYWVPRVALVSPFKLNRNITGVTSLFCYIFELCVILMLGN